MVVTVDLVLGSAGFECRNPAFGRSLTGIKRPPDYVALQNGPECALRSPRGVARHEHSLFRHYVVLGTRM